MSRAREAPGDAASADRSFADLVEEISRRLERNEPADVEDMLDHHPQIVH
jgi:hypothetical protein